METPSFRLEYVEEKIFEVGFGNMGANAAQRAIEHAGGARETLRQRSESKEDNISPSPSRRSHVEK